MNRGEYTKSDNPHIDFERLDMQYSASTLGFWMLYAVYCTSERFDVNVQLFFVDKLAMQDCVSGLNYTTPHAQTAVLSILITPHVDVLRYCFSSL